MRSNFVVADGVRTHFIESGSRSNPTVILVHGGEFGGGAELAWERTIDPLAKRFHVLAPDMIGYGLTDKIVELGPEVRHGRRIKHLAAFARALDVEKAAFVGNSLGGSTLMQDAVSEEPMLPMTCLVSISGHAATDPDARAILQNFDGSSSSMAMILELLFHHPRWTADAYVERKLAAARIPGAFEAAMAARVRSPMEQLVPRDAGRNATPYERVTIPVLICIGERERICPDWGREEARRIPGCELSTFQHSAHCAHLEEPELFNECLIAFLERYP